MADDKIRYTKDHEWVRMDGDMAVVGITDHAQKALGDITFVDLPQVGADVTQFEAMGVIESVKAASDLNAPVGGTVEAVNEALHESPDLVNKDAMGEGWLVKIRGVDAADLDKLMDAAAYKALCDAGE